MNRSLLIASLAALTASQAFFLPASAFAPPAPPTRSVHVQGAASTRGSDQLQVAITLAPFSGDPSECGTSTNLDVNVGDQVNVCYTLTNNSGSALSFQSLTDSVDGAILTYAPITIANGQSYPYVRTIIATGDSDRTANWTGYVNVASYTADDTVAPDFIDISGTGADTGIITGDGGMGPDPNAIGEVVADFPLRFYGQTSTALCVSNDGLILFGDAICTPPFPGQDPPPGYSFNQDIPATNGLEVPTILAPMWMNLNNGPGRLYAQTLGTAPDRTFVLQWNDIFSYVNGTTGATFEVVFAEDSDTIRYEYASTVFGDDADNGAWATVGLQADPNGLYTKYSYYQASLSSNSAIQWDYTAPVGYAADSDSVHISAGDPTIAVPTATVDAVVAPGQSATATLTIRNTGNRDLHWNLDQAPGGSAAHFPKTLRHTTPLKTHELPVRSLPLDDAVQAGRALSAPAPKSLLGSVAAPAYGISSLLPGLVTFDALNPLATYTQIDNSSDEIYSASFIGNDFSKLYVIVNDSWEIAPGSYGTLDTTTGAFTQLGTISGGTYLWWSGMTQDPLTGTVYAVNYNDNGLANAEATLYTIDLASGHATRIGLIDGPGINSVHFISGIAVSPAGLMYGLDLYGQQLIAIDKNSGAASVIDSLGLDVQYIQSIAFDEQTGTLYWAALYNDASNNPVSEIRAIDPLTAQSQPIGPLPPTGQYPIDELSALAIATPSIGCAAPGNVPWLSFSPDSGTIAAGADDQDVSVTFDANGLDAGLHQATICVHSDDPQHPTVAVPVSLAVSDGTLYDQNTTDTALRAFNNTVVAPPGTDALSSEGADDFVVDDPNGWTVTSFSFSAYGNNGNPLPSTVDIAIYNDDGSGHPGTTVLCQATAVAAIPIGDSSNQIGVWLPQACPLPSGTYWVAWSFANVDISSTTLGFWGEITEPHNQPAVWRNPGGALGPTCTDWTTFAACPAQFPDSTATDFGFTVFGTTGGSGGGDCGDVIFADGFDGVGQCTNGRPPAHD